MLLENCKKGILYTSATCTKCPAAKEHLKSFENVEIREMPKAMPDAKKYGFRSLPVLVLVDEKENLIDKLSLHEILEL